MTFRQHLLASSILCATLCAAAPAAVAQTAPSTHAPSPEADIADIIVTAQKRSESISNVGMAITAVSGDQLKALGIDGVAGITKLDPSFVVTNSTYGSPIYSIRGINFNNYSLAASPVVSIYSDEIPYAYPALTKGATYDLERVEVLKGPQGTLYGQSSTAGAINYISAKPTKTFAAGLESTYGSFNAVNFNGYVSGPLSDTLAMRLAFTIDEGGAWQKSMSRDDVLGKRDSQKLRLITEWKPTDRLSVSLNVNGWLDRSDSRAGQFVTLSPQVAKYLPLYPALVAARAPGKDDRAADWAPGIHPRLDQGFVQVAGRLNYRISDGIALTYLGSYESYAQNDILDNGGTATQSTYNFRGRVDSVSQEARLSGDLAQARINWLVGASYQDNITLDNQIYDTTGSTTSYAYVNLKYTALPYSTFTNTAHDDAMSKAAFFNLTFKPIETLSLHGGARYTDNVITHGGCTFGDANYTAAVNTFERALIAATPGSGPFVTIPTGGCVTLGTNLQPAYITGSLKQDNVSWRVGADWKPFKGTLAYVSVSKGYKAGSFPTITSNIYTSLAPAVEESLLSYEGGIKSRFFHNLIEIDGDVFYYDYHNKQLEGRAPSPIGIANLLVNVPRSYEVGAELAVTLRPLRNLVFNIKQTYLRSKILGSTPGYDGFGIATNFEGQSFPQAPRYSVVGDGQYSWHLHGNLDAFLGFNLDYRTKTQSQLGTYGYTVAPYALDTTEVKAYALLGLRAGIDTRDGRWRFEGIGNNVTNTYYWTQEQKQGDTVVRYTGRPAEFLIRVAYKY